MGELELPQGEDLDGQVHGGLGQDHSGLDRVTPAEPGGGRGDVTVLLHPLGLHEFFEDIRANHPRHMPAGIAGLWLEVHFVSGTKLDDTCLRRLRLLRVIDSINTVSITVRLMVIRFIVIIVIILRVRALSVSIARRPRRGIALIVELFLVTYSI